jgi:hypothetical protein
MTRSPRTIALSLLVMFGALMVVGAVSHGVIRHLVQTAPFWPAVVLGSRGRNEAKWCALPCFVFWILVCVNIWFFLFGWAHLMGGTFTPTEIAMTVIIFVASVAGLVAAVRWRTSTKAAPAVALSTLFACLQLIALRVSLLPQIAHR